jgi:hypothetical protein
LAIAEMAGPARPVGSERPNPAAFRSRNIPLQYQQTSN